jgi:hypothetical protein
VNKRDRANRWCIDKRRDTVGDTDGEQYARRSDQKTVPSFDLNRAWRNCGGAKQLDPVDL